MPVATSAGLIELLRDGGLLLPEQLDEAAKLPAHFPDPEALSQQLVRAGLLTEYQSKQIWEFNGLGLVLESYVLLDLQGKGNMGQVFKARHRLLGRVTALKVISKECLTDADSVARFQREARAAARLAHCNIVTVYDFGKATDGTLYLAMEYVGGRDLAKKVKEEGPLPVALACDYIRQAALGLQHSHECNVVHRDVKPHNIMVSGDGALVKVLDFGLASWVSSDLASTRLTKDKAGMGTPHYMSPEQSVNAHDATICSDIYSLGCTLYHLLAGKPPFYARETYANVLAAHLQGQAPPPLYEFRNDVPPELEKIISKMKAKESAHRYQTPAEVAEALEQFCEGSSSPSKSQPSVKEAVLTIANSIFNAILPNKLPPPKQKPATATVKGGDISKITAIPQGEEPRKAPVALSRIANSIGMQLVLIPNGRFTMGSPPHEPGRDNDEEHRKVKISKPFYMGIYTVTQAQYQRVINKNPSHFKGAENPMECINWFDAMQFCQKLSDLKAEKDQGRVYRLPTKAEWEYACRAGSQAAFCYGDDPEMLAKYAWYDKNSESRTHPVGKLRPNDWELHDMHGNVWEWCADYDLRGGSWNVGSRECRSAFGDRVAPGGCHNDIGFRVVCDVPASRP